MGCGASTAQKPAADQPAEQKSNQMFRGNTAPTTTPSANLDRQALLREVFDAMDLDHDGKVTVTEFVRGDYEDKENIFGFMDSNSDGEIDFDEWTNGIKSFNWSDAKFESEMNRTLEALRAAARRSAAAREDNEVALPTSKSNDLRRPKLEKVFEVLDEDKNGFVDIHEFLLMSSHFGDHDISRTIFSFMDANGDGKLTLAEWIAGSDNLSLSDDDFEREMDNVLEARAALARARSRIEGWGRGVFAQFDANKDGMLSREELANALKALPKVSRSHCPS